MSLPSGFYPHLNRVLARQRRQMLSDFLLWGLIAVGLIATIAS